MACWHAAHCRTLHMQGRLIWRTKLRRSLRTVCFSTTQAAGEHPQSGTALPAEIAAVLHFLFEKCLSAYILLDMPLMLICSVWTDFHLLLPNVIV